MARLSKNRTKTQRQTRITIKKRHLINRTVLLDDIKLNLQAGILSGRDIGQIALDIGDVIKPSETDRFRFAGKRVFKTAQNRVEVITRTEVMRAYNQGRMHLYHEMKVEKVIWYTTKDERVCPVCGPLNGQEFEMEKVPLLPRHPSCRCVAVRHT